MKKEVIKKTIADFHSSKMPATKPRLLEIPLGTGKIIALTGVRRSGKTYQLYNVIKALIKKQVPAKNLLYFNFEDERIDEQTFILNNLLDAYRELYPDLKLEDCYFLFDEIQNIEGWEKFLRRIYDQVSKNIFITGSNSKLLSKEISTSLRGRSISYEVFPLSFKEYLNFLEVAINLYTSESTARIIKCLEKYLYSGGFPELINMEDQIRNRVLQEYFDVMILRDIIERYDVKQSRILKYFCKRVVGNSAQEFSVNKIFNELKSQGYKISKDTLYEFQSHVESIYLALFLPKHSHSFLKSELAMKKTYCIDTGLASALDFYFSQNNGRLLENLVFLELKKAGKRISYYSNNFECDFVIYEGKSISDAIQVCFDLNSDYSTKAREINGVINTCKTLGLREGKIITISEEEKLSQDNIEISIIPAYKYILSDM
jgi:predicted AAA+ superfamily ATPase